MVNTSYLEAIDAIKSRYNILGVVADYIENSDNSGRKSGSGVMYKCPFHNEKTGSFYVDARRQTYYCFGCQRGGDVITFVEELNGWTRKDTIKNLAEKIGIKIYYSGRERRDTQEAKNLYEVMRLALSFYTSLLTSLDNSEVSQAREYLERRKLSEKTIRDFKLGYALSGWSTLTDSLPEMKVSLRDAEKAGLIKKKREGSGHIDIFRGRIMIPIFDIHGRIIGFSGRSLDPDDPAKYINSPKTPLYDKSQVLYGVDLAYRAIREQKEAILEEGYFDIMMSHQDGVHNVLGIGGTSFTEEHMKLLQGLFRGDELIFLYDGDKGGRDAAKRAGKKVIGKTNNRIVLLPEGKDPADIVKDGGHLEPYLVNKNRRSFIDFYIDQEREGVNLEIDEARHFFLKGIFDDVWPQIVDAGTTKSFMKAISERANIDLREVTEFFLRKSVQANGNEEQNRNIAYWETRIIGEILSLSEQARSYFSERINPNEFQTMAGRRVAKVLLDKTLQNGTFFLDSPLLAPAGIGSLVNQVVSYTGEILEDREILGLNRLLQEASKYFRQGIRLDSVEHSLLMLKTQRLKNSLEERVRKAELSGNKTDVMQLMDEFEASLI